MKLRPRRRIAILGSTGSIGTNALEVVREFEDRFEIAGLSAHSQVDLLEQQCSEFRPDIAVVASPAAQLELDAWPAGSGRLLQGEDALVELATREDVDIVVAAIVGSAGMMSTLAAIEAGKRVALANKETLVVAGHLACEAAHESGAEILPVDSEHSAIFQAIKAGRRSDVKRVILTASGGPFRGRTLDEMADVTVDEALAHPTWEMGRKITIDSATMMNKALEIIEARWLFDLQHDEVDVVVHPQSIIHSLVEFDDGSVIAQLSPPDMKLPIQYALTYPDRMSGPAKRMDWSEAASLDFEPPDFECFPALELGLEVARRGGTAGVVLNAANEIAVQQFLDRKIKFTQIAAGCRAVLDQHHYEVRPSLETLRGLDRWARQEMEKWIFAC